MAVDDLSFNCLKEAISRTIGFIATGRSLWSKGNAATRAYHFNRLELMNSLMLAGIRQFQVFNTVGRLITVYMVDYFTFTKRTAKMFRHYKNVFGNIAVRSCVRVARTFNQNVTPSSFGAATLPARVRFTFPASFWPSHNGRLTLMRGYVK